MTDEISLILNDRESGSVALLNRLIAALEKELNGTDLSAETFINRLSTIRKRLNHFAAIENFLAPLVILAGQKDTFPGECLHYIADYSSYWHDNAVTIAENFLQHASPHGKTILTHSHSQTVISLLNQLHVRQISFLVLQTLSAPGEEGKKSYERMRQLKLQADLIDDAHIKEALSHADLVLMGCDALLTGKFLNKTGTRAILKQAKQFNLPSFLVTESRKEIARSDWERQLSDQSLFEWVPLNLIDRIVTERQT